MELERSMWVTMKQAESDTRVRVRARGARARRAAGFTLIEVLVAMAVLSIGLVAIASVSTFALRHENAASGLMAAMAVAEERMAILATVPVSQLADATASDTRCETAVVLGGVTVHAVTCSYTAAGSRIDMTVSVTHPLANNPVQVTSSRFIAS